MAHMYARKRLGAAVLAALAFCYFVCSPLVYAAGGAVLPSNAALDLGSTSHSFSAPNAAAVRLNVGGHAASILPGQSITPAEYLAIMQVLNAGAQSLNLSALGTASGGHAVI